MVYVILKSLAIVATILKGMQQKDENKISMPHAIPSTPPLYHCC